MCTVANHLQFMPHSIAKFAVSGKVFERADNQSQRRSEFMCDVRKEAQTLIIEFLFMLMFLLFGCKQIFESHFPHIETKAQEQKNKRQHRINELCPPREPKRWIDGQF